jgi:hypothetical protein
LHLMSMTTIQHKQLAAGRWRELPFVELCIRQ